MKHTVVILAVTMAALSGSFIWAAEQKYLPMPPTFSATADPAEVLRRYPLGAITKQAAFSHHGQATRSVVLPNSNEGWVYRAGEESGLRTFTLVFSEKGVVIDVLYNERGRHNGLTALQLQAQAGRLLGPDVELQPYQKHPPEVFRGQ